MSEPYRSILVKSVDRDRLHKLALKYNMTVGQLIAVMFDRLEKALDNDDH